MTFRTDRNNNPTAFTTDIARHAGLAIGDEYVFGDSFANERFHTARLIGDPIALTIKVIDKIGFHTHAGSSRWSYVGVPDFVWQALDFAWRMFSYADKKRVIGYMYMHEGGTELKNLFV